jgi:LPS-assembly lipoprotein
MWLRNSAALQKALRMSVVAGLCLATLAACGFSPAYQRGESRSVDHQQGASSYDVLQDVFVAPIPERIGQVLRNSLTETLQNASAALPYTLEVSLEERIRKLGIQKDTTATRAQMIVIAKFSLRDNGLDENNVVYQDEVRTTVSYNILTDNYATVIAERNARDRGARDLSQKIIFRLIAYFATHVQHPAAGQPAPQVHEDSAQP